MTDDQLLERLRLSDPVALEAVVYRYHASIYTYLVRLVRHTQLAEDLTQECFFRVCGAVKSGRLPSALKPWLYKIATNLCKDQWKKASTQREVSAGEALLDAQADEQTVTSILERQWEREEVIRALMALDEESRGIVILRYYEDLKLQEIAEIVQLPINTLKWKLYRALKQLAGQFETKEAANDG